MHHVAIMKKEWGLIPKILSGEKTIESRWYKARFAPWNKVKPGDTVYFKNSGEPVTVIATVSRVEQFENLNPKKTREILDKYGQKDLGTTHIPEDINDYVKNKTFCIIIHLKNPRRTVPFKIDKSGFGSMSAWIYVDDIVKIKKYSEIFYKV